MENKVYASSMFTFHQWLLLISGVLLYTYRSQASYIEECPPPEDNYPCYCEEDEGPVVMHCNYLNESKQIHQALNKLSNYKVYKVSFFKNEIEKIESNAFQGPAISQIIFTHSTVNMENPQFAGLESSLTRITFLRSFNSQRLMKTWSLSHLEKLKEITFDENEIKVLKNDWMKSPSPSLRSLTFSDCHIEKLEDKVFSNIENLATIFLSDNAITSVSRSMFPKPASNLRSISLTGNKIETLPNDIFVDMPSLSVLELQKNQLKTLQESTWSTVIGGLTRVYLDGNPIVCDEKLKWISKTRLPSTFSGKCVAPPKLKGKDLRNLIGQYFP